MSLLSSPTPVFVKSSDAKVRNLKLISVQVFVFFNRTLCYPWGVVIVLGVAIRRNLMSGQGKVWNAGRN